MNDEKLFYKPARATINMFNENRLNHSISKIIHSFVIIILSTLYSVGIKLFERDTWCAKKNMYRNCIGQVTECMGTQRGGPEFQIQYK